MNLLVVDAGNSRCKICYGKSTDGFPAESYQSLEISQIDQAFESFAPIDYCIVSSVNGEAAKRLQSQFTRRGELQQLLFLDHQTAPIRSRIEHPETLGSDRIAAAFGAFLKVQSPCIVIDSGTAVTIDSVDELGGLVGGVIFPGAELASKSLSLLTDKLPKVDFKFDTPPGYLGDNTVDSIRAGIFWSQVGAIERVVNNYRSQLGDLPVLVTGGFGETLLSAADFSGQYCRELVLEGLWQIGINHIANAAH